MLRKPIRASSTCYTAAACPGMTSTTVASPAKLLLGVEDDMCSILTCIPASLPVAGILCISLAQQQLSF